MAEHLAATNKSFELHYCVRSRPAAAFLDRLQAAVPSGQFFLHCDDAGPSGAIDFVVVCRAPTPGKHLYVCGPSGFMDAALGAARQSGWPEQNLHREYFAATPVAKQGCRRLPGEAGTQRPNNRRGTRSIGDSGPGRVRGGDTCIVRAGGMRNLRNPGAGRRAGASRLFPNKRRAGEGRPIHTLLLACQVGGASS